MAGKSHGSREKRKAHSKNCFRFVERNTATIQVDDVIERVYFHGKKTNVISIPFAS
jgi:hypothetical protein